MVFESTYLSFAAPFMEPWGAVSLAIIVCLTSMASRVVLRSLPPKGGNSKLSEEALDTTPAHESKERVVLVNALPNTRPDGTVTLSNALEPGDFDSGVCYGKFLLLHKPTDNPARCASGEYPHGAHMHGRRRNWEFRLQLTFRETVEGEFFFGAEQDRYYPVGRAERCASGAVISVLRRAANGMYQSHGDDPTTTQGECERPEIVFPLWVMDQLIITEEDEQKPSVRDPDFSSLGMTKSHDRPAMRKALNGLRFIAGRTYTLGFWCISPFVDAIAWSSKSPFGGLLPQLKLTELGTHPPAFLTLYALKPREQWGAVDQADSRHLDSRKVYLWRVALWSSKLPPTQERAAELIGETLTTDSSLAPSPGTPWTEEDEEEQQRRRRGQHARSCCSFGF